MINEAAAILPEDEVRMAPSRQFLVQQSVIHAANEFAHYCIPAGHTSFWLRGFSRHGRDIPNCFVPAVQKQFRTLCARYNIEVTT